MYTYQVLMYHYLHFFIEAACNFLYRSIGILAATSVGLNFPVLLSKDPDLITASLAFLSKATSITAPVLVDLKAIFATP